MKGKALPSLGSATSQRDAYEVHLDAPEILIHQGHDDAATATCRVGTMYRHPQRTDLAASFAYDPTWLRDGQAFMLDPRLALWTGEQHPPASSVAFGVFMDSAPDRWGRVLMERREAAAAQREGRPMRRLQEVDFLLGVYDLTRMGGLRFRRAAAPFAPTDADVALAESPEANPFLDHSRFAAPPFTELRQLAAISRRIEEPGVEDLPKYDRWLAMLVAPGSSLGGARPKANFTDVDQRLWVAKFPAHDDRYDVGAWEYVTHQLAHRARIEVPQARLEALSDRYGTFCSARFDRIGSGVHAGRRMYASAMTLLERQDGEAGGSYLDLAEFITDAGAQGHVETDLAQLFRRVVFNVLIGNRDDHLRNHGFVRVPTGWRLAPAFDVNPSVSKAEHALALDGQNAEPNLDIVMQTAELYRLSATRAREIAGEVRAALAGWRDLARQIGLAGLEIRRMEAVIQG